MTLKNCIDNFIAENEAANNFIEENNKKNADEGVIDCVNCLNESKYNSLLGLSFANKLQLLNDPFLVEQFELKDIELLYDNLLALNEKYLNIYVDAAYFADSVLDNNNRAKEIVEIGINKLQKQLLELEELQKKLSSC
jgi:hypothetical protein